MSSLTDLLQHAERVLGPTHRDLRWYDTQRKKRVTKQSFFEQYAWSLLVWNRSRASAESFARNRRFWQVITLASTVAQRPSTLLRQLGVDPHNSFGRRILAIVQLGRRLGAMSEASFRRVFFDNEGASARLSHRHATHLRSLRLYGVGPANAAFIVRNMGGELLKCDRWILALLDETRLSAGHFQQAAQALGWGLGRVDAVLWSYCEQEVNVTSSLPSHLRALGFTAPWTST